MHSQKIMSSLLYHHMYLWWWGSHRPWSPSRSSKAPAWIMGILIRRFNHRHAMAEYVLYTCYRKYVISHTSWYIVIIHMLHYVCYHTYVPIHMYVWNQGSVSEPSLLVVPASRLPLQPPLYSSPPPSPCNTENLTYEYMGIE
jgi:hypothetical protein